MSVRKISNGSNVSIHSLFVTSYPHLMRAGFNLDKFITEPTHTYTATHSLSLSLCYTHTHTLTNSCSHTYRSTLTHTHTDKQPLIPTGRREATQIGEHVNFTQEAEFESLTLLL